MPQSLSKRADDLERRIKESADLVKKVLREYRETVRASSLSPQGQLRQRERARLDKKRSDVERANKEYMQLQKELDRLRSQLKSRA